MSDHDEDLRAIAEGVRQSLAGQGRPAEDFFKELEARFGLTVSAYDLRPTSEMKSRVADLMSREKLGRLTEDETTELDRYMEIEHLGRLAKARMWSAAK